MLRILLRKEYKEQIRSRFFAGKKNIISSIVGLILSGLVIALFVYIFNALNSRFINYGVSKEIFILAIFSISVLEIIMGLNRVTNALYNFKESGVLLPLPIKAKEVILSKVIIMYINEIISITILLLPLIISFGINTEEGAYYYITSSLLFFIVPLFSLFIMILLSIPYVKIRQFIKDHPVVQLILALLLISLFFIAYRFVITLFIGLVNDDRLSSLFNKDNAIILQNICKFAFPANLTVSIIYQEKIVLNLLLVLVIISFFIVLSFVITAKIYQQMIKAVPYQSRVRNKKNNLTSPRIALYKKELITMFRSSNYLLSYITILLLLPLIVFIIAGEMKVLVIRLFGESFFLPFVVLMVTSFSSLINGFGSFVISREGIQVRTLKTLPIHYKTQVMVKLNIALAFSLVSTLLTSLVLGVTMIIPFIQAVIIFIISSLTSIILIIMMVKHDLHHPNIKEESNGSIWPIIYSLTVPLLLGVTTYFITDMFGLLAMVVGVGALLGLIILLNLYSLSNTASKCFSELEV